MQWLKTRGVYIVLVLFLVSLFIMPYTVVSAEGVEQVNKSNTRTYRGEEIDKISMEYDMYVPSKLLDVEWVKDGSLYTYEVNNVRYVIPPEQIRRDIEDYKIYSVIVDKATNAPISTQNYLLDGQKVDNLVMPIVDRSKRENFPVGIQDYEEIYDIGTDKQIITTGLSVGAIWFGVFGVVGLLYIVKFVVLEPNSLTNMD